MVFPVRDVPWWGVLSSAAAAVLLAGGWTVAAMLQPGPYDQVTQTISALAAHGATDRWVMSLALLSVGACHVITGLALRPAAAPGRVLLMTSGVATVLVAANPLPAGGGRSVPHTVAAAVAFLARCWRAARAGGAVGAAAGCVHGCQRGTAVPARLVLPGAGHGGQAARPGRAGGRGGAGAVATCGGYHLASWPPMRS
jgi:hypothetical membrane protein